MRRWLLTLVLLISIIVPLSSCAAPIKVKVAALTGITGLAMVDMMNQTAGESLYDFSVLKSPELAVGKLITGEADLAGLPTNVAAILYNRDTNFQLAAIIGWGVMYLVGEDASIKTWKDLQGREVYVASKGAVSDLLLQYLISRNGLDPATDVTIHYQSSASEIAQLMAAGKNALAALPEPWATMVLERNPRLKIVLDYQSEWERIEASGRTYPQTCIMVSKQFLRTHPRIFRRVLNDMEKSIGWVNINPEAAGKLAEQYLRIPAQAVKKGITRCNLKYVPAVIARREIELFFARLHDFAPGAIGGNLPDARFYYQP